MKSSIWLVRHLPSTISMILYIRPKPASMAPSMYWVWPSDWGHPFSRRRPVKCTERLGNILRMRPTGEIPIPLAPALAAMKANDGRVVSNFIVQALADQPSTIYGDSNQTRSFCYVGNMIDAFVLFMSSRESITGPLNLGNPTEITVHELAERIIDMTGSSSTLVNKPLPADDPVRRCPDIALARYPRIFVREACAERRNKCLYSWLKAQS